MQTCLATWLLSKQFDAVTTSTNEMSTSDFWYHDLTKTTKAKQLRSARPKCQEDARGTLWYIHLPASVRYCAYLCVRLQQSNSRKTRTFHFVSAIIDQLASSTCDSGSWSSLGWRPPIWHQLIFFELSLEWLGTSWNILEHAKAKVRLHVHHVHHVP